MDEVRCQISRHDIVSGSLKSSRWAIDSVELARIIVTIRLHRGQGEYLVYIARCSHRGLNPVIGRLYKHYRTLVCNVCRRAVSHCRTDVCHESIHCSHGRSRMTAEDCGNQRHFARAG